MPIGSIVSGVGALAGGIGSILGGNAEADAAKKASQNQMAMYNRTRQDLMPYITGGGNAFASLQGLLGLNGGNPQSMLAALEQTPGYQFAFNQGQTALDRSAASRGLLLSGGQLKDSMNYGQGMAQQVYQQTVGNLQNASTLGANAAAGVGTQGQNAAAASGQFQTQGAQATAAGYTGLANALGSQNGVFQNAINAYQLAYPSQGQSTGYDPSFVNVTPNAYGQYTSSDRRLKTDIRRVGKLDSGLPIYSYRFIGSKLPQIGVMSDEVRRVAPRAVRRDPRTGFDTVHYGMVSRLPAFKEAA